MQDKEFLGIKPNFSDKMGFSMDLSVEKYEKDGETGRVVKKQFKKSVGSFIENDSNKTGEKENFNLKKQGETVLFSDPKGF
jgi:hypothetical protein